MQLSENQRIATSLLCLAIASGTMAAYAPEDDGLDRYGELLEGAP